MIRMGLMGCGVVANYGHLPAILRTQGLQLVSLFDPDSAHLVDAQRKFGAAQAFTDVEQFFRSPIDAVAVTSPAPAHCANVLAAAAHGKHVLCEKPLSITAAEGEQMAGAMERAGLLFALGFTYRFSPSALEIKRLVEQGAIGAVRSLRLVYIWNVHGKYQLADGKPILNQRRVGRMLEGGPMVDCGVHQIDLARWWLDSEVVRQQAAGAWVDDYEAPDHLYLHMDHANGAHSLVEISYSYGHTAAEPRNLFTYDLIGTEGVIHYDRASQLFELRSSSGTRRLAWYEEKGFDAMYVAFEAALRTGRLGDLPTARDGLIASDIAWKATHQAIERRAGEPQPPAAAK